MEEIALMEAGKFDIHTDNQHRLLNLGSHEKGRTFAKNFIYQMIFQDVFGDRGMAAAGSGFAAKADFQHVFEGTQKQRAAKWEEIAQAFFNKYNGLYQHSVSLVRMACTTGHLSVPSGRFWTFKPEPGFNGDLEWPRTKILNYPVQGFSADLVQIARLWLWEHWFKERVEFGDCLLINTVHDDIEADVDNDPELVYNTCMRMEQAFSSIPQEFKRMYGTDINVPMAGEVKFGVTLNEKSMKKFKKDTFQKDYMEYLQTHGSRHAGH